MVNCPRQGAEKKSNRNGSREGIFCLLERNSQHHFTILISYERSAMRTFFQFTLDSVTGTGPPSPAEAVLPL